MNVIVICRSDPGCPRMPLTPDAPGEPADRRFQRGAEQHRDLHGPLRGQTFK